MASAVTEPPPKVRFESRAMMAASINNDGRRLLSVSFTFRQAFRSAINSVKRFVVVTSWPAA